MSTPKNSYTTDIVVVVHALADRLNKDYKTLAQDFTGGFEPFFLDICSEIHSATPHTRQTMSRSSFQNIVSALKKCPRPKESSLVIDGLYHLRQFSTRPDVPNSLFCDGKAVIAHDSLIYVLRAIWEHASLTRKMFKDIVASTCAFIPVHIVSRFFSVVHPRRVSVPTVPKVAKVALGSSSFGHTVIGESYLRIMSQNLTPGPSASAGKDTSSLMLASRYISNISSTSAATTLPSPDAPASAISISASTPIKPLTDTRKRMYSLHQDESLKRRKIDDGESGFMSVLKKRRDKTSIKSGAGAAGGGASQRQQPVAKLPKSRSCPLWPWNLIF